MSFNYIDFNKVRATDGIIMTVVSGIPSPWGESAKGIFHIKKINWKAVRHTHTDDALSQWTGFTSAPVLATEDGKFRASWSEILLHAETIEPFPSLIPASSDLRAKMFGLSHELMGEDGLCWLRRLQLVHAGKQLQGQSKMHADYIGNKYGYSTQAIVKGYKRICELLELFSGILKEQHQKGLSYYLGSEPSALDIYSATSMALFSPLPDNLCRMDQTTRMAFNTLDAGTRACLNPIILAHRDLMYEKHLALPLSL